MFTARFGLIPYIKQIAFRLLKVKNDQRLKSLLLLSLRLKPLGHASIRVFLSPSGAGSARHLLKITGKFPAHGPAEKTPLTTVGKSATLNDYTQE